MSHVPFSAGILSDEPDRPLKPSVDDPGRNRDAKQPKAQVYPEKHSGTSTGEEIDVPSEAEQAYKLAQHLLDMFISLVKVVV